MHIPTGIIPYIVVIVALLVIASAYKLVLRFLLGTVIVGQSQVGIVTKKWVIAGKNKSLPDGTLIALNGEAGIQADTLAPGIHFGLWAWQYSISLVPLTTIETGTIGVVESRDGKPLNGRVLASTVDCDSFQSARKFLEAAGQRGPQIAIIPPGVYRINTALFDVTSGKVTEISQNKVGIVTTQEGAPLAKNEIAGKEVAGHHSFQDAEAFLRNGGSKGLQEQVILSGRYFINPKFATVQEVPMTDVPIANVGVVIAYVGEEGQDQTGEAFKHGNLVARGQRGVWMSPLDPGKYPINPYTHRVENVPTANIVLNWADAKSEAHKLDANLSTITVRSSDGFAFNLDVSQIIHVPHSDAPKVIARFGTMANLVTQVLEPTIGNYFRNAAQTSDVISFLKERTKRQNEAKTAIQTALNEYNVNAIDTLIGDIVPPADLMKTLTDRKKAEQENLTYQVQQEAQEAKKNLEQATAMAATQARVVDAERSVSIAEFKAQADVKKAEGDAKAQKIAAEAQASATLAIGRAEAEKALAIGTAEATVIQKKTAAMDKETYAAVKIVEALAGAGVPLVPQIVAGGTDGGGLMNVLLARMLTPVRVPALTDGN